MSNSPSRHRATSVHQITAAALVALVSAAHVALAKDCGDLIQGGRVACACGDTVVTDTTLRPDDPVVRERCFRDGLRIRAAAFDDTLRLDLAGLAIVGSGVGDGIAVQAGGNDGARILGGTPEAHGEIVGFETGIDARNPRALARLEALDVIGQRRDGVALHTAGAIVIDVRATSNGGDGFRIDGNGGRLVRVRATSNTGTGVRVQSRYTVIDAVAEKNSQHGILVRGQHNDLRGCIARDNRGYGVVVGGAFTDSRDVVAEGNGLGGVVAATRANEPQGKR